MKKTKQSGVTLLELMFTLTILAIVIGFGAPGMWNLMRNSRIAAETNDLVIGLHAGRAEAVKRRAPVVLCASPDAAAESPACGVSFYEGWVVFVDRNANGSFDADADPDVSDIVIEAHGAMRSGLSVATENNYFAFAPSGFGLNIAGMGDRLDTILICDDRGNQDTGDGRSAARLIALSTTARPQILTSVADVDARTGGCP